MNVRDAVEADAEALASLADAPTEVMCNLVHDRTVRVASSDQSDDDLLGFVSYDVQENTVHVTQFGGSQAACEHLFAEPVRFASREEMDVEVLVEVNDDDRRHIVESAEFVESGRGPTFGGVSTVRYRKQP